MSHPEFENVGNTDPANRVIEESSELILAIAKAHRFGWFSTYHGVTNLQTVRSEIHDCIIQFGRLEELLKQYEAEYYPTIEEVLRNHGKETNSA
jgi:hypothetical protein